MAFSSEKVSHSGFRGHESRMACLNIYQTLR
jgi:hypothetical protein